MKLSPWSTKFSVSPVEPWGNSKFGMIVEFESIQHWGIFVAFWRWILVCQMGNPHEIKLPQ
jgi:hypothetical protein